MVSANVTITIDNSNFDHQTIKVCKISENTLQLQSSNSDGVKEADIPLKGSNKRLIEEVSPFFSEGLKTMTISAQKSGERKSKVVQTWGAESKRVQTHLEKAIKEAVSGLKEGPVASSKFKASNAMPLVTPKRRKDEHTVKASSSKVKASSSSSKSKSKKNSGVTPKEKKAGKQKKHHKKREGAADTVDNIVAELPVNESQINVVTTEPVTNSAVATTY